MPVLSAWVEVSGNAQPYDGLNFHRNRSRSDQILRVDPRRAVAARGLVSGLVFATAGRSRNPKRLPELVGSGALCHTPPHRAHRGNDLELRRSPSDYSFRYFLHQVDVAALCAVTVNGQSPRSLVAQLISIS